MCENLRADFIYCVWKRNVLPMVCRDRQCQCEKLSTHSHIAGVVPSEWIPRGETARLKDMFILTDTPKNLLQTVVSMFLIPGAILAICFLSFVSVSNILKPSPHPDMRNCLILVMRCIFKHLFVIGGIFENWTCFYVFKDVLSNNTAIVSAHFSIAFKFFFFLPFEKFCVLWDIIFSLMIFIEISSPTFSLGSLIDCLWCFGLMKFVFKFYIIEFYLVTIN